MAKKCPPGVFCIENFTIAFVIISLLFLVFFTFVYFQSKEKNANSTVFIESPNQSMFGLFPKPSYSLSNVENDVYLNPYSPPLKDDRIVQTNDIRGGVPININTRAVDTNYRQVGILKRLNGPETILPLMGRPLYVRRDKWQYYTLSDSNNQIKLPISFKSKSCTNEYGCDEVYDGDTVYVEGMNSPFKVTLYDNATMKYIPYI
jgi:hypothetical protein